MIPDRARALLDFWFAPEGDPAREKRRQIWFKSTPEFDALVRENFLAELCCCGFSIRPRL